MGVIESVGNGVGCLFDLIGLVWIVLVSWSGYGKCGDYIVFVVVNWGGDVFEVEFGFFVVVGDVVLVNFVEFFF